MTVMACLDCGAFSEQSRCPQHRKQHELTRRGVSSGWSWTETKKRIKRRDHYRCQNTVNGKPCLSGLDIEVDHIIPREFGGTNHDSNLQVLCGTCHSEKTRGAGKSRGVRI